MNALLLSGGRLDGGLSLAAVRACSVLLDYPPDLQSDDEHSREDDDGSDGEKGEGMPVSVSPPASLLIVQVFHIRSGAETPMRESPVATTVRTDFASASLACILSGVSPRNLWF